MGGLIFRIKYEPMNLYANKMMDSYKSIEYNKLDLSKNTNVKTASNYVDQEDRINDLVLLYKSLVTKDVKDIKNMIQEMEESDKNRSRKWNGRGICISDFDPGRMHVEVMYGPPRGFIADRLNPNDFIGGNGVAGGGGGGGGR